MRRLGVGITFVTVAVGAAATAFWLGYVARSDRVAPPVTLAAALLTAVAALSTINLVVRWLRWHFLTRRLIRSVDTRTSFMLYFGTLPAFATPLYLGELVRTALLARRLPRARRTVFAVWAMERLCDAAILLLFLCVAGSHWLPLSALILAGSGLVVGLRRGTRSPILRALSRPWTLAVVGATSGLAWLMPVTGLWLAVAGLGEALASAKAAGVFASSTLLGGVSLLPLGAGVTGSSMILQLGDAGVGAGPAIEAVALFRAGTAWYALCLGLLALVHWRHQILSLARESRPQQHFDELAEGYGEQIPEAVRDRLVGRKVQVMQRWLRDAGVKPGARGLDVGCGQGWYAAEMARLGHVMSACDRSRGQVDEARRFVEEEDARVALAAADAGHLPYADASFDFVYGVNVIHHITDPAQRRQTLREIVRVLVPGGCFFLQEINTENPLFAFYMGYVFPLIREIDDGTEAWVRPSALPAVEGARWDPEKAYLTFLPDFTPAPLLRGLAGVERALERSSLRSLSAHYVARLVKDPS